jgi:hypothetical protein
MPNFYDIISERFRDNKAPPSWSLNNCKKGGSKIASTPKSSLTLIDKIAFQYGVFYSFNSGSKSIIVTLSRVTVSEVFYLGDA